MDQRVRTLVNHERLFEWFGRGLVTVVEVTLLLSSNGTLVDTQD